MRLPALILLLIIISAPIAGQGVTRNGSYTTYSYDFVDKEGRIVQVPSLTRYGQELLLPVVTTADVTSVTINSAIAGGNVMADGGSAVIERGVCWSTSPGPTIASNLTIDGGGTGSFASSVINLTPSTTYYLRAYATNTTGTAYGEERVFQTGDYTLPEACLIYWYPFDGDANEEVGLGADGMVSGAVLTEDRFGSPNSAYYFNGTDNFITVPGFLPVTNSFTITFWAFLEDPTGYNNILSDGSINIGGNDFLINFRVNGIGVRADKNSLSLDYEDWSPPELVNLDLAGRWVHVAWAMNPGRSTVFLNGSLLSELSIPGTNEGYHDDHITIGARHVWTTMDNYFHGKLDDIRIYSCELDAATIYGIYSGGGPMLPAVTTSSISIVSATEATGGGNVTNDGGSAVTSRGVCWGLAPLPTLADNHTIDGSGPGVFSSTIAGLTEGQSYYVRAYATNGVGTIYGNEVIFTAGQFDNCGTVTDIDGNIYNTVTIGTQCWMQENLKVTRYSDGTPIPFVNSGGDWDALTIDSHAYCWYDDDINNGTTYGALYSWSAAMNGADTSGAVPSGVQGVCPTGWHLPSWNEWGILINHLDPDFIPPYFVDSDIAGGKMKETGTDHWLSPNTGATNETGFTALPGGGRGGAGEFFFMGTGSYWWSTTQFGSTGYARGMNLSNNNTYSHMTSTPWDCGISVRCIKDATPALPSVNTITVTDITSTTAVSGGTVVSDGGSPILARGICWGYSPNPTMADNFTIDGAGTGTYSSYLSDLNDDTVCYVRAYATNSAGTGYGSELNFTTPSLFPNCGKVTDIDGNVYRTVLIGAQCWLRENLKVTRYNDGGTLLFPGTDNVLWRNTPTGAYSWYNNDGSFKDSYGALYNWYSTKTGRLCPTGWHVPTDEEYYDYLGYSAVQLKEAGTAHWPAPNNATNVTGFTALPGGMRFYGDGSYRFLGSIGFFWTCTEAEHDSTVAWDRYYQYNSDYGTASYDDKNNGLAVRCVRGEPPSLPVVTSNVVSVVSAGLAIGGGNALSDGGSAITSRGVCWSTSPNPTKMDFHTSDGAGTGPFGSDINMLIADNTYYLRAYATNGVGTAYGNEVIFSTPSGPFETCGTITDADGNIYNTIIIGTQCWMQENLKTTRYNDGSSIPLVTNNTEWADLVGPGYCWHSNDETTYKNLYGALYNWYTVNTGMLCPVGWHVPTYDESWTLANFLGGEISAGGLIKEKGTVHWASPNTGATNQSGFTALPGGARNTDGNFGVAGYGLYWWTSTEIDAVMSRLNYVLYNDSAFNLGANEKQFGASVRCIRNE